MDDETRMLDQLVSEVGYHRGPEDGLLVVGSGFYELFGEDGELKQGGKV